MVSQGDTHDLRPGQSPSEKRRFERRGCTSTGALSAKGREFPCTIVNISDGGGGIIVNAASRLSIGDHVVVKTPEIGEVACEVRWAAHPRYGLQLATSASVPDAYRRFFESLSPEALLAERMDFMKLDAASLKRVASLAPVLKRELPAALGKLYDRIRQTKGVSDFFPTQAHIERAKASQENHWGTIASGNLSGAYFEKVRRIGETHARIGLDPHWYIGGYALIIEHLIDSVVAEHQPRSFGRAAAKSELKELGASLAALVKTVLLDVGASISIYLDAAAEARLEGEAETITRERESVSQLLGASLAEVAQKNLTHRMSANLPDVYKQLQVDFNDAVDQIDGTLITAAGIVSTLHTGLSEIAKAADDLSSRTEQQAASLQETASAMSAITATVAQTTASVRQAQEAAVAAENAAKQSVDVVHTTVEAMGKISGSSRQIAQIIGVIDEIAFQTNLLALNAGVEAARAGDAGRGFSVVAAEVRALAQRTAEAAKEIKQLISTSTVQVNDGVNLVDATGSALEMIANQIRTISAVVSEISSSASSQARGLNEINLAIAQMDEVTQQNAAMAEQATAACRTILQDGERLASLVDTFSVTKDSTVKSRSRRRAA